MSEQLENYLSEEQKQRIAEQMFRERLSAAMPDAKNVERILTNNAYTIMQGIVDPLMDDDMKSIIKSNVKGVVNGLSNYNVFKAPDAWDREASRGWELLQEALSNSKDRIEARVHELIDEYVSREFVGELRECVMEIVEKRLFKESES